MEKKRKMSIDELANTFDEIKKRKPSAEEVDEIVGIINNESESDIIDDADKKIARESEVGGNEQTWI